MPISLNPLVIDLSHFNQNVDFAQVKAGGVVGVVHKATQGSTFFDKTYAERRQLAEAQGLLWGAYHFLDGSDVTAQIEHFWATAQPDTGTLIALDFEENTVPLGRTASIAQLHQALQLLSAKMNGAKPVLYSGSYLKDQLGGKADPFLGAHRLWLAQYSAVPVPQVSWKEYWLWQFTDGAHGLHYPVKGVNGQCDVDHFAGDAIQLVTEWVG